MTDIEIGTVVDFPRQPGYIAGTVVRIDDDYIYVTDGHQNRKYPRDNDACDMPRPHRHGWSCDCDD